VERTAPVPDLINHLHGPLLHPMVQDLSIDSHQAEYHSMGGDGKHLGRQLSWIQKKTRGSGTLEFFIFCHILETARLEDIEFQLSTGPLVWSGMNVRGQQGLDLPWPRREAIPSLGYHDFRFLGFKVVPC